MRRVFGRNLKVGDTIEVWWKPGRDTITKLTPYEPPPAMAALFPRGAQLAEFALYKSGMTIDNAEIYDRIAP